MYSYNTLFSCTGCCAYCLILYGIFISTQARRQGGAFRGHAPPNKNCAPPPKRGLCAEEINWLGAIEVQIEA